ncbi:ABC transporter substrate-binding protein [Rhizobium leguminosarum bv. trifolii CB782]|uniref:DUF1007 domain-containing protein n=1 Tax=Rhizobium hidalgonense TaxID=1538159 RepID=A0A2A6KJE9_9HYPH|nr:DUF1007 family protein [Rhizobium hidalgonense]AHG46921.1 ABC transporter substrate-binding protein [Rhizobium leguminosarum bv. trifolii CB782]EJC77871.1 ABC-type uncharacterized transport system, periplasmic component [Rhizobium leguminosarum bv. trifolii WSM2012]MDR9775905.1 DUF1007 family protein [Rhizobium hidalgonense]MDR9806015.1 DUF1007 family protein [Rhizobium hidalgonense]MDR9811668.1 DUF1007 family protein [Rhizobium hidalgonense]
MKYSTILIAALVSLAPAAAFAHPHIFVEARLEVVADKDGNIEELRNVWRFDEVFSSSVVMDFDKNTDLKLEPNELAEVGKTVKQSLAEYDYYMNLTINGKNVTVQKPDIIHVDYKDGQLLMFFAVKPAEKMPLKGRLTFGVYDPSLYTSIDFPTDNELSLVGDGFKTCKHQVVRPDADQVISQNKQSLTDAFFNDPTGTNMSKLFATRLEVTC